MADELSAAPEAVEITTDPAAVDVGWVVDLLLGDAYWGRWRSPEQIYSQVRSAWRTVAAIDHGTGDMVGFARAVSDGVGVAYLADVVVRPDMRGQGIGSRIVSALVDGQDTRRMRWMLHTQDGHDFYAKFGFGPANEMYMERRYP